MNERLMRMTRLTRLMIIAPLAILGIVVFTAIGGGVVMLLWNWLAPTLFGLRLVTFWQAIGLLALCRILFGGFGLRELSIIQYRSDPKEVKENVLFILRRGCHAGLELL